MWRAVWSCCIFNVFTVLFSRLRPIHSELKLDNRELLRAKSAFAINGTPFNAILEPVHPQLLFDFSSEAASPRIFLPVFSRLLLLFFSSNFIIYFLHSMSSQSIRSSPALGAGARASSLDCEASSVVGETSNQHSTTTSLSLLARIEAVQNALLTETDRDIVFEAYKRQQARLVLEELKEELCSDVLETLKADLYHEIELNCRSEIEEEVRQNFASSVKKQIEAELREERAREEENAAEEWSPFGMFLLSPITNPAQFSCDIPYLNSTLY